MTLWTIQPVEFYEKLCSENEIQVSDKFIEPYYKRSYDWLITQMEKKVSKRPNKNSYPIWAWCQYESENKRKPDLRHSSLLEKGTNGVRIEFEKPKNEVLLSDFDLWYFVLNYSFIADNEEQDLKFDSLLKSKGFDFINTKQYSQDIREKIEDSWNKIFDMNYDFEYSAHPIDKKAIQATFWKLKKDEITNVVFFKAR